jgi:hypothetical protein
VSDRERKRAQRQKRKARGAERRASTAERRAAMAERSERRNAEAREKLEPLAENERPRVVTISAIVAAVISIGSPITYVLLPAFGADQPPLINIVWPTFLMGVASYGLWHARYWAVLGFDVVLVFLILIWASVLVTAKTVLVALVALALIAGAGTLFFFMVKAMARIQMPERRTPGAR